MHINAMMTTDAYNEENMPDSLTDVTSCNKHDGDCDGRMGRGVLDKTEEADIMW